MLARVHFFEWLAVVNAALLLLLFGESAGIAGRPLVLIVGLAIGLTLQWALGVGVRLAISAFRRDRGYLRRIRRRGWLLDSARIVVFGALTVFCYGWLKLVLPVYRHRVYDEELWQLDRLLFFGGSPTEFFLNLFSTPAVLRTIDWSYANLFYTSAFIAFSWFASEPSRRIRIAFVNGNAALWTAGAWLYFALPSLGPAYRFPEVWFAHSEALPVTQWFQAQLMRNYSNVIRLVGGDAAGPIRIVYGIAAFPSLHVASQFFVYFWMRRLWQPGRILFALLSVTIFVGSMVTGWHYLTDALAGIALAFLAYRVFWRTRRIERWLHLRRRLS